MTGRFEGLSDSEWEQIKELFPSAPKKRSRGMPHVPFRLIINTLINYILITGCRWCDVPKGPPWASKSAAHRWLTRWKLEGTLENIQNRILGLAENIGKIEWNNGAVDGSFSPGKGGGEGVGHGHKGKGVLILNETDANGMPLSNRTTPANGNERAQVILIKDAVKPKTGKPGRPRKRLRVIAADKGYDSKQLRRALRNRGIRPQLPKRVWKSKKTRGRPISIDVPRFQIERTFAWFQRKYRRLVVRWERLPTIFDAFLSLATIHIWLQKLIVG